MTCTDRIVIEVDDDTARKWRLVPPKDKQKLYGKIGQLLKASLKQPEVDFWEFVNELREEAQTKGLTEEKLQCILDDK